jgi:hypothetical protein
MNVTKIDWIYKTDKVSIYVEDLEVEKGIFASTKFTMSASDNWGFKIGALHFKEGQHSPQSIKKTMCENRELKEKIIRIKDRYVKEHKKCLTIKDVKILRADIRYIRKVTATGEHLQKIEEVQQELHNFLLYAKFSDGQTLRFRLKSKMEPGRLGYSLSENDKHLNSIEYLLYPGWKGDMKKQISEFIDRQNLQLPILFHEGLSVR